MLRYGLVLRYGLLLRRGWLLRYGLGLGGILLRGCFLRLLRWRRTALCGGTGEGCGARPALV